MEVELSQVIQAIEDGDVGIVMEYLRTPARSRTKLASGRPLIFLVDVRGVKRLHQAEILRAFLEAGADVNYIYQGQTLLDKNRGTELEPIIRYYHGYSKSELDRLAPGSSLRSTSELSLVSRSTTTLTLSQKPAPAPRLSPKIITPTKHLQAAIETETYDRIPALIKAGADIKQLSCQGSQVLAVLARKGAPRYLISHLLAVGADPDATDYRGNSAVHLSIVGNALDNLQVLIQGGANINLTNTFGSTPLSLAVRLENLDALSLLLDEGANPNIGNTMGDTPLHFALTNPYPLEYVHELLIGGAQVDQPNHRGLRPIDLARQLGDPTLIELLNLRRNNSSVYPVAAYHRLIQTHNWGFKQPWSRTEKQADVSRACRYDNEGKLVYDLFELHQTALDAGFSWEIIKNLTPEEICKLLTDKLRLDRDKKIVR